MSGQETSLSERLILRRDILEQKLEHDRRGGRKLVIKANSWYGKSMFILRSKFRA